AALADDHRIAGPYPQPNPGAVAAGIPIAVAALHHAVQRDEFAVPTFKTEDGVGFGDGEPALDIREGPAASAALANALGLQFLLQRRDLTVAEAAHLVRTAMCKSPLVRAAPSTGCPDLRACSMALRSGLGGCGTRYSAGIW